MTPPGRPPGVILGVVPDREATDLVTAVLPAGIAVAAVFGNRPAALAPAERRAMAGAVPGRVAEFATGRGCARAALARVRAASDGVDVPAMPVLAPNADGSVSWPAGTTGSITHCTGLRAAAVASRSRVRALGIDAEAVAPFPRHLIDEVVDGHEQAVLARELPESVWPLVAFCAKEALYKVWSPLRRTWLGFGDARIRAVARHAGVRAALRLELVVPAAVRGDVPERLDVAFAVSRGFVVAGAVLGAEDGTATHAS